jgi:hypothetical protein
MTLQKPLITESWILLISAKAVKLSLSKQLETLNPFLLRKIMDKKMKKIFSINDNHG